MTGIARWRRLLARGSSTLGKLLPAGTGLSAVLTKYLDETEEKLDAVLESAERRGGILSFDEEDALIGQRSEVQDLHDRYADPEVGYLRQPAPARDFTPAEVSTADGACRRPGSQRRELRKT